MPSRDLRGCFLAAVTVLHYKNQGWLAVQSTFPTLPSPETVVTISSTSSTLHMHLLSGHTTLPAGSSWSPGSAASSMAPGRETVATLPDGKLSVLALGTHCAFIRQSLCWVPPEVHLKPASSPSVGLSTTFLAWSHSPPQQQLSSHLQDALLLFRFSRCNIFRQKTPKE